MRTKKLFFTALSAMLLMSAHLSAYDATPESLTAMGITMPYRKWSRKAMPTNLFL